MEEVEFEEAAAEIISSQRIMALSSLRQDGWPQTTIVGYVNEGLTLYFMIFRSSQKFANIDRDHRVSLAVGQEPSDMRVAKAVFAAAIASEVTDPKELDFAWQLLKQRHPNLTGTPMPDLSTAALMRADCRHLSVLDYSKGLGHTDALHISGEVEAEQ